MMILYLRFVVFKFYYLGNILNEEFTVVEYTRTEVSLLLIILHVDKFIPHIPYIVVLPEDEYFGRNMS
jgi:hypothetical protein